MSLNLSKTVSEYLQAHPEEKFTARQIADWIFKAYPTECREKRERSKATVIPIDSDAALVQQLAREIGSQRPTLEKRFPQLLKTTEGRPRRYYYSSKSDEAEVAATENSRLPSNGEGTGYTEHDLYPMLVEFYGASFLSTASELTKSAPATATGSAATAGFSPT